MRYQSRACFGLAKFGVNMSTNLRCVFSYACLLKPSITFRKQVILLTRYVCAYLCDWRTLVLCAQDLKYEENSVKAVQCLNDMVTNALIHMEDCLIYMAALRDPAIFRFCAIPQVNFEMFSNSCCFATLLRHVFDDMNPNNSTSICMPIKCQHCLPIWFLKFAIWRQLSVCLRGEIILSVVNIHHQNITGWAHTNLAANLSRVSVVNELHLNLQTLLALSQFTASIVTWTNTPQIHKFSVQ